MTDDAFTGSVEAFTARLEDMGLQVEPHGIKFRAQCPAHGGDGLNLAIESGELRPVVATCWSHHCSWEDICNSMSLNGAVADITVRKIKQKLGKGVLERIHPYVDEDGVRLFEARRFRMPDGSKEVLPFLPGALEPGIGDTRRVLYNLPTVLDAIARMEPVWVVEGESDADALMQLGVVATCNLGGAGNWKDEYGDVLEGGFVVLCVDRDTPGTWHGRQVSWSISHRVRDLKIVEAFAGKDARDHLEAGYGVEQFLPCTDRVPRPTWDQAPPFPDPLADAAFIGLAGRFVQTVLPHSEADAAALLVQFLVAVGNAAGPSCRFVVEATIHHLNEFLVAVGATSRGRKGTSLGHIKRVVGLADPSWAKREVTGLSSAEGLIERVQDPEAPEEEHGDLEAGTYSISLPEIEDRRLFVIEEEFSAVLANKYRTGNRLSPILRQAWDGGRLETLTRTHGKASLVSTNHCVSIIAHSTPEELVANLETTEAVNGFANRFLWIAVRRSKALPHGGDLNEADLDSVITDLEELLNGTGDVTFTRDTDANDRWEEIYDEVTRERKGIIGALTARAEAHVMRLACIYALLDRTTVVQVPHLEAAFAIWRYCEETIAWIFSGSTGNADADKLLRAIRATYMGLTRTEIVVQVFTRNRAAAQVDAAIRFLIEAGLIRAIEQKSTGGRPATRYVAC